MPHVASGQLAPCVANREKVRAVVGVYRCRNAGRVNALIGPALSRGWRTAWWALDSSHPLLSASTIGEGPGEKPALVNETLRRSGISADWTVVADDDIRFCNGDVVRLVDLCERGQFDLAQAALAPHTHASHPITIAQHRVRARTTTFVESGPLYVVGPRFRDVVLPLSERWGMGWGIEFDWIDLLEQGCRLGVVDSMVIEHLGKVAAEYDSREMRRRIGDELVARGATDWPTMQQTLDIWRPWQRRPPWHQTEHIAGAFGCTVVGPPVER
jgi:hypothetical protein